MVEPTQILEELAALLEKYQATISYSNDDEGIDISVDGTHLFTGFLSDSEAPLILRVAKYHKEHTIKLKEIYLRPTVTPSVYMGMDGGS